MTNDFAIEWSSQSDINALCSLFSRILEPYYDVDDDAHLTRLTEVHHTSGKTPMASISLPK